MSKLKARVLAGFEHGESFIPANVLILAAAGLIESLKSGGVVDDHKDAIAYGESEGFKTIELEKSELSESMQQRLEEKQAANESKELTAKQKATAIAKMPVTEKKVFEKSGLPVEQWLQLSDEDRTQRISAIDSIEKDELAIANLSEVEKNAFEKSGKTIAEWQALPEADRTALIKAEKSAE
ncbi:MAG TPA: hypothetical protein VK958_06490 [Methylophilus sp.]|uniref:hypothetical protein n=1 Tax=Methylophilus sp. TaxID=29541 RepID=UPI002C99AB47|nr:hypothetical protein [Methylophilus sp.]HSH86883.1 hypothetical protein [Methylophilus sp.]